MKSTINRLTLKALLLSEITRLKFGRALQSPKADLNTRKIYGPQIGVKFNAKPAVFIAAIRQIYADNGLMDDFDQTLQRFKINTETLQPE